MPLAELAVVISTLNAAEGLARSLACLAGVCLAEGAVGEVVLADGGSVDGTIELARAAGVTVVAAPRGRGPQLAAGAAATAAPWLLFLHADTVLRPGWQSAVRRFMVDPDCRDRAGYFRLALDDPHPAARRIERLANWRSRRGLPYGDQGLLIARGLYDRLGGFRPLPLMEDVDLVRRIGRRRLTPLDGVALTSAARYRRDGYMLRPLRNLACLVLYFAGVPPRLIRRLYG
ncbi:MAG TPA: TIGR04283 family arsenosugar biosynthesis glycosyltransferase [Stellaceae bacterium]|nr:TIGR04283 family arsenosugar biosynthesis glycosyltransferase [Stellaceae bacterium]